MSRTARLFQLLQCLRNRQPPVTAGALADDLGISVRTVYRDIDTLRGLGTVIDGAAGFGFTLIEDNALPPLGFEEDEIEALVLGLREVQQIGDPVLVKAAGQALAKLRARLPERQSHRLQHAVLSAHRFTSSPEPGVDVARLRQAAWDEATVRFTYRDAQGRVTVRAVDPLGIVYFESSHCLLAYCHLRRGYRVFRLDRMSELVRTGGSFRPRRVPMLRDCLSEMRTAP